jgi:tetratricopeptide (TPR) repeat protein
MAETKPKLMLVDCGDIYHRLGICYAQIKRWNDGIKSYANALKEYRKNDMNIKFAECLNNLGTLYLTACKIEQAEQCFLHSYEIKKS